MRSRPGKPYKSTWGGLKIVYDLLLWAWFRRVPLTGGKLTHASQPHAGASQLEGAVGKETQS